MGRKVDISLRTNRILINIKHTGVRMIWSGFGCSFAADIQGFVSGQFCHTLQAQSQAHETFDRLEERGVERGSDRRSSVRGRERVIARQTGTGTAAKTTLGKFLRSASERLRTLPNTWIIFSAEPKLTVTTDHRLRIKSRLANTDTCMLVREFAADRNALSVLNFPPMQFVMCPV